MYIRLFRIYAGPGTQDKLFALDEYLLQSLEEEEEDTCVSYVSQDKLFALDECLLQSLVGAIDQVVKTR